MRDFPLGLREVIPNQAVPERTKDTFQISTGGTQSTLQEIKLPDGAGGFVYTVLAGTNKSNENFTRNRFITWCTSHDVLELNEVCLDYVLQGGRVRYRFQNSPILANGVSIHETVNSVVVLVATVSSVHKMVFPSPRRIRRLNDHLMKDPVREGVPSVFAEATPSHAREHFHVLPSTGTAPMPHLSATWLTSNDEAIFALSNSAGQINVVKIGNMKGMVMSNTLKSGSYLGRLWGNIGGILTKTSETSEAPIALEIHPLQDDVYVFGLCKDLKLRMWSTTTYECVMAEDVQSFAVVSSNNLQPGSQVHRMRKITDPNGGKGVALALFLCFAQQSHFCILRPSRVDGQFQAHHMATIYSPEYDLVDFQATWSHLWVLWTNPDSEPVLRYCIYSNVAGDSDPGWNDVILDNIFASDFHLTQPQHDPRQVYLRQLFYPGRFSMPTLIKTLNIYRRAIGGTFAEIDVTSATMDRIREDVCSAVENEIRHKVTEYEISDEEYLVVANQAWQRFYSCALQYHQTGLKPLGLVCDHESGLICLIKKMSISFVRPVDALEHLMVLGAMSVDQSCPVNSDMFHDTPILCEDPALAKDVIHVLRAAAAVESLVPPHLVEDFSGSLLRLVSPDQIAKKIVKTILTGGDSDDTLDSSVSFSFLQELSTRLQQVGDIARAIEVLLISLELDRGIVSHAEANKLFLGEEECSGNVFGSPIGVSIVAESLKQFTRTRFDLTRDLIVLQLLLLECGLSGGVSANAAEVIHSTLLPRSVVMAHCYFVLVWLTETAATAPPPNSLEQGLRQMVVLKISDRASFGAENLAQLARLSARPLSLAELFLRGPGGLRARSLLTSDTDHSAAWRTVLTPLVNISAQLLWPRCAVSTFQEFLLAACQHLQIQEYVRLLSTWCDWNCHSRQFLLGTALLHMSEPEKAADWMIRAAEGVLTDSFLVNHLFSEDEKRAHPKLHVLYFLKIIEVFQQFGYSDLVIELAKTAVDVCDVDDPNRTTLCHILFNYHLKLGHNNEAYDAMITNPDTSRRRDSLRQFVVTLFDRKQLKQLASFPYIDMFEELEQIIEARARSCDLSISNFYDFLYSFHITKENYRKAAQVMYECGMRLGMELCTPDGVKQQGRAYLSCLNCLKLVNSKYAWIVKPVPTLSVSETEKDDSRPGLPVGMSPKRTVDGDEIMYNADQPRLKMEVLEIADIEKEFELVCARLKLVHLQGDSAVPVAAGANLSPPELASLLITANLYEDAIHVSKLFELPLHPVFEGLTSRCVKLSRAPVSERSAAWDWLAENNSALAETRCGPSSVETAWFLLETLVGRYEVSGQSHLHKAVALRLISSGSVLPAWLVAGYKKANAAELLRLYYNHGYLEDAAKLVCEYVTALLGPGKEYFGLETSLNANAPPVWMPINTIEQVMMELETRRDNPIYKQLAKEVEAKVQNYLDVVERVSRDMIELRRS